MPPPSDHRHADDTEFEGKAHPCQHVPVACAEFSAAEAVERAKVTKKRRAAPPQVIPPAQRACRSGGGIVERERAEGPHAEPASLAG